MYSDYNRRLVVLSGHGTGDGLIGDTHGWEMNTKKKILTHSFNST